MKTRRKLQAIVAISVAIACSASANVVTNFATADTRIGGSLTQTNINNGGADQMLVGNHTSLGKLHGLLRFDLSSLGTNIVINSVTLQMNKPAVGTGSSFTVNVFELSVANTNWVEGTANNVAQSGSATWDSKGPSAWAGSAGASTAGTDYINTVLASYGGTIAAGDAAFTSQAAFLTSVSNNLGGSLNLGIGMNSGVSGSYYRFATDEHATAAAPALVIDYTVIPEPATLGLLGAGSLLVLLLRRMRG
jgi:hypothetical protein